MLFRSCGTVRSGHHPSSKRTSPPTSPWPDKTLTRNHARSSNVTLQPAGAARDGKGWQGDVGFASDSERQVVGDSPTDAVAIGLQVELDRVQRVPGSRACSPIPTDIRHTGEHHEHTEPPGLTQAQPIRTDGSPSRPPFRFDPASTELTDAGGATQCWRASMDPAEVESMPRRMMRLRLTIWNPFPGAVHSTARTWMN